MRSVWKYELAGNTVTEIEAPQGAQFLQAALQPGKNGPSLVVWAMVDPEAPLQTRRLLGVATGEKIEDALGDACRHLATVQAMAAPGGPVMVVHIFEVLL